MSSTAFSREPKAVVDARTEALMRVFGTLDDVIVFGKAPAATLRLQHDELKARMATYTGKKAAPTEDEAIAKIAASLDKGPADDATREAARALQRRFAAVFELVDSPAATPDMASAARMFKDQCVRCHGDRGAGDGVLAKKITPPLASLSSPELLAFGTPYRFYERIATGVDGTAMPGFRDRVTDAELWNLAFYVSTLPLGPASDARTTWRAVPDAERQALAKAGLNFQRLSVESITTLAPWLKAALPSSSESHRNDLMRTLRQAAPFSGDVGR